MMLETIAGLPKITKLCIIVIVKGDMKGILKVIWNKRLVPQAEEQNILSAVQFGNRKGRMALDTLLLKIVTTYSIRLLCLNGAILNNDALACYDRMIPECTVLHLRSLGLPELATKCSVLLNHNMQHHVKTAHGISKTLYRHIRRYRKFSEGQGKTSSPSNWLFTSSTLLNALHSLCTGLFITSICKKIVSKRVAEAYVDDSDCTLADQRTQDDSPTQICNKFENIAQTWEQLLFSSGGLLSLDKTFWWLIWWDWTNGEPELANKNKLPLEATIHLGYDQTKHTLNMHHLHSVTSRGRRRRRRG